MAGKSFAFSDGRTEPDGLLLISNSDGRHFIKRSELIYIVGDANLTSFFLLNHKDPVKHHIISCAHNLGYYSDELLAYHFARANQSIIFNLDYLLTYTREFKILLTVGHPLIQVSSAFKQELEARLP
jgi:hypothetical protein